MEDIKLGQEKEKEVKRATRNKVLSIIGTGILTAVSVATFVFSFSYDDMVTKAIGSVIGGVSALGAAASGLLAKNNHDKSTLKNKSKVLKLVGYPVVIAGVLASVVSGGYLGFFKHGIAHDEKQAIANENHTSIEEVSTADELANMNKDLGFTILGVSSGMAAAIAGALSAAKGRKFKKASAVTDDKSENSTDVGRV